MCSIVSAQRKLYKNSSKTKNDMEERKMIIDSKIADVAVFLMKKFDLSPREAVGLVMMSDETAELYDTLPDLSCVSTESLAQRYTAC